MGGTANGSAFNTADALGRLMNNKNLYQRLLGKFAAGYGDYDAKLAKAAEEKNFGEGADLAHSMKGLSGNLGAEALQEASRTIEMLFKAGDPSANFAPALEAFAAELRRALDEIAAGVPLG